MRLNVKFKESKQSFNPAFGEVNNISDGGYERGYQAGYDQGYADGFAEGETKGKADGYNQGYDVGLADGENSGYTKGYEAGYQAGYAKGKEDGYAEGHSAGFSEGETVGYNNGYTEGKTEGIEQGYNEGYTKADNENPFYYIKSMAFAFSSRVFSAEKSNIVCRVLECTDWNMAFGQLSGIKTLKIICDTQGLNVVWQGLVRQSADIELLDLTEFKAYPTTIAYLAYQAPKLKTILGALDLSQCTTATAPFGGAKEIEDIEFVPNTIKISIEFSRDCTKLTKTSLTSIINGLSADTSGLTVTISKTAVNNAFTDEEWATLIATKSNWTISLS